MALSAALRGGPGLRSHARCKRSESAHYPSSVFDFGSGFCHCAPGGRTRRLRHSSSPARRKDPFPASVDDVTTSETDRIMPTPEPVGDPPGNRDTTEQRSPTLAGRGSRQRGNDGQRGCAAGKLAVPPQLLTGQRSATHRMGAARPGTAMATVGIGFVTSRSTSATTTTRTASSSRFRATRLPDRRLRSSSVLQEGAGQLSLTSSPNTTGRSLCCRLITELRGHGSSVDLPFEADHLPGSR